MTTRSGLGGLFLFLSTATSAQSGADLTVGQFMYDAGRDNSFSQWQAVFWLQDRGPHLHLGISWARIGESLRFTRQPGETFPYATVPPELAGDNEHIVRAFAGVSASVWKPLAWTEAPILRTLDLSLQGRMGIVRSLGRETDHSTTGPGVGAGVVMSLDLGGSVALTTGSVVWSDYLLSRWLVNQDTWIGVAIR